MALLFTAETKTSTQKANTHIRGLDGDGLDGDALYIFIFADEGS
jgi:hypothetical protein